MMDKKIRAQKTELDQTFKVTLTSDELIKRAAALGFRLEIDPDTEIASLFRVVDDGWSMYTGHWTSILPWMHGYAICALYLGHL